jgi:hypothetical protein
MKIKEVDAISSVIEFAFSLHKMGLCDNITPYSSLKVYS